MAVEIANVVHAMGMLNLQVAPEIVRGAGIASIVRNGVGDYAISTDIPLDINQGIGLSTLVEGGGQVNVNIQDFAGTGPRNIQLVALNAAGAGADLGFVQIVLFRLPQQT